MIHTSLRFFLVSLLLLFGIPWLSAQEMQVRLQIDNSVPAPLATRLSYALHNAGALVDTLSATRLYAQLESGRSIQLEGMQGREVHGFLLYLTVRYAGKEQILSSGLIELSGSGTSAAAAQRNAINQLRPTHDGLRAWINQYTEEYSSFFGANCNQIISQADQYAQQEDWLIALALVDGIPVDAACVSQRSALRERYYLSYQTNHCNDHLNQAQLALTQSKAKAALDQLAMIDPESPCAAEAQALLTKATAQLEQQEAAKAAFLRQVYQNQVKIETARNQIIADLVEEERTEN